MQKVLVIVTRGEAGGAQLHVRDLVGGLRSRVDFHVAIGDDTFLAAELRNVGVPVHLVPDLCRAVSPVHDQRAFRALRALVARLKPAVVHTHSSKAGVLGRLAARAEGVPALHTAHGWAFSDGAPWLRKAYAVPLEAAVCRVTQRLIVVSDADRELAARFRVAPARRVRLVRNGVPDTPERASPGADGVPIVTMVARLAAPKDHLLLLRALSGINLPFSLRLVGDGPDRDRVAAAVIDLGLAARVTLLGERRDVASLLASSHVSVLTSRHEGLPLAILEAMRAGLPVVASDVGGVREAVEAGRTGLLVARGDEAGLRHALRQVLGSPALRRDLGDAGRRAYEGQFTVQHMLDGTAAVYRELAEVGAP